MPATRMLGRRPPSNKPTLHMGRYLTGAVPTHPVSVNYLGALPFQLYGNDAFGDCGAAMVANSRIQITGILAGAVHTPSQDDVFDLYRRSGNPNFDPKDPGGPGDGGVDLKTMLAEVVRDGIGGTKAVAFAAVDVGKLEEIRAAIDLFGSLHLGVDLQVAQQYQGLLWDFERSPEWGGHAVLAGKYSSASGHTADVSVVSWGEAVGTTDAFWAQQVQEAYVLLWPEHLTHAGFQAGVDLAALAADFTTITGRPFPSIPSPNPPTPAPAPVPPVPDFVGELLAMYRKFGTAVEAWASRHGL